MPGLDAGRWEEAGEPGVTGTEPARREEGEIKSTCGGESSAWRLGMDTNMSGAMAALSPVSGTNL